MLVEIRVSRLGRIGIVRMIGKQVVNVRTKSKGSKHGNGEFTAEHARCGNVYECGFKVAWY